MNQLLLNAALAAILAFANAVLSVMTEGGTPQLPGAPSLIVAALGAVVAFVMNMQQARAMTEETVRALKGVSLRRIFRVG